MFSYNGGNKPESKTTCMFHRVHQLMAPDCILFVGVRIFRPSDFPRTAKTAKQSYLYVGAILHIDD